MSHRWHLTPFDPSSAEQAALWRELAREAQAAAVLLPEFVFVCAEVLAKRPLTLAVCGSWNTPVAAAIVDTGRSLLPEVFIEDQMPLGAFLARPGADFESLARSLTRSLGLALRLGVSQLDSRYVQRPVGRRAIALLDHIDTAWVEVGRGFDQYWGERGKNLRTNMRRQREKLAAQGIQARTDVLSDPGSMEQAVREYAALESKGWKSAAGTAVSEGHPQAKFYARMLGQFARLGHARVYRHWFDDRLVAAELCLHDGREMIILKTTYDQGVAPFSPASLLRQDMFRELFEDGHTRRIEFYGPVKDWHLRWSTLQREIFHANVYRMPMLRRLAGAVRTLRPRSAADPADDNTAAG